LKAIFVFVALFVRTGKMFKFLVLYSFFLLVWQTFWQLTGTLLSKAGLENIFRSISLGIVQKILRTTATSAH